MGRCVAEHGEASLLSTLSSQQGNGFSGSWPGPAAPTPRWPTYAMAGATFPVTRPSPEDVAVQGAWLATQRERFQELQQQPLVQAATNPSRPAGSWPAASKLGG